MEHFHVSTNAFPFYYGLNFLLLSLCASFNVKFIQYFTQVNILKFAILMQIILAMIFSFFYLDLNLIFTVILIGSYISMNGLIYGNATALVLENFPENAGVASALIGVIQFGLASILSSLIVSFHGQTLLSVGIGMLFISLSSFIFLRKY
jgi:DHA1 family bicyclomycin/chloramphenicol resistance-like MFS transporter